ncbi:mannan endo-1,4-beta-mannosidase precursor [Lentisphaera araneosa HTCC2155]|uniref:Mannan endo-1,4-beta-mannosidase n=1 Tax=Lentisphaera araneosa HTCC2155 TaxID=313628 RepID=A6DQX2_9BACT|nr:mannan endo-1,4-beta-mannosidase precursor [Lentisphaera araneosa]EDM26022.1 mannan endo-1,4-beta-mannosidase precursor [Lentisphaera araneosa HTCC2155]
MKKILCLIFCYALLSVTGNELSPAAKPIDEKATKETVELFNSLRHQMGKGILFGHQNTTLYGVGWHSHKQGTKTKSDCFEATGQYPVVYGWDINSLWNPVIPKNKVKRNLDWMRELVLNAYERGGVNTFSWHLWNPISPEGGNFYDTTPAVHELLSGGKKHTWFKAELDKLADFFYRVKAIMAR